MGVKIFGLAELRRFNEVCAKASPKKPVVFFVGSGISSIFPSSLPSAHTILEQSTDLLAPRPFTTARKRNQETKELTQKLLPELFYETITDITDRDVSDAWGLLEDWKSDPVLAPYNFGPNSIHLLITYLSWISRVPIITPNYDMLFEESAQQLSLKPIPSTRKDGEYEEAKGNDEVAIWKIHGSVSDKDSISYSLRQISVVDFHALERIKSTFERAEAICFIGYSGRDIDFSPTYPLSPFLRRLLGLTVHLAVLILE